MAIAPAPARRIAFTGSSPLQQQQMLGAARHPRLALAPFPHVGVIQVRHGQLPPRHVVDTAKDALQLPRPRWHGLVGRVQPDWHIAGLPSFNSFECQPRAGRHHQPGIVRPHQVRPDRRCIRPVPKRQRELLVSLANSSVGSRLAPQEAAPCCSQDTDCEGPAVGQQRAPVARPRQLRRASIRAAHCCLLQSLDGTLDRDRVQRLPDGLDPGRKGSQPRRGRDSKRAAYGWHRKWTEPRQSRDSTFRV